MTDSDSRPKAAPATPTVPVDLLEQYGQAAGLVPPSGATSMRRCSLRHFAEDIITWAWAQREEEVRQAEQRGADAELAACCKWVSQWRCMVGGSRPEDALRAARRPVKAPPEIVEIYGHIYRLVQ